jgi:hypothetical protein
MISCTYSDTLNRQLPPAPELLALELTPAPATATAPAPITEPKLKPALGFVVVVVVVAAAEDEATAEVLDAPDPKPKTGFTLALGLLVNALFLSPPLPSLPPLAPLVEVVVAAGDEVPKLNFAPPTPDPDDEGDIRDPKVVFATAAPPKGDGVTDPDPCCCC